MAPYSLYSTITVSRGPANPDSSKKMLFTPFFKDKIFNVAAKLKVSRKKWVNKLNCAFRA